MKERQFEFQKKENRERIERYCKKIEEITKELEEAGLSERAMLEFCGMNYILLSATPLQDRPFVELMLQSIELEEVKVHATLGWFEKWVKEVAYRQGVSYEE